MLLIEDTSIMPVLCFMSSQLDVKCTETSSKFIFMTLAFSRKFHWIFYFY